MLAKVLRTGLIVSMLALAAACSESTMDAAMKGGAETPVPARLVKVMNAKDMPRNSPILARVFKEENKVEIWKQKSNGRYDLLATYDICKMSGKLGPKFIEGDRQSPEGFYTVRPHQLNPKSQYHLAINIGYPNTFDRANGRTGSNLMVHGACSSSGCFSMNDAQMTEIYALARDSFRGGQTEFQIQSFPFRMTPANMARYKDDPNYQFWKNLKEGYDHFEITKTPPKVDVCEKRYVFNAVVPPGTTLSPTGKCPEFTPPESLKTAYQSYQSTYEAAFASAIGASKTPPPKPSIAGIKEASLVSEWTRKRARGERVPLEPPSLAPDGTVIQTTTRMGRIDSPAGRRMAELEAAAEAKRQEQLKKDADRAAALAAAELAKNPPPAPAPQPAPAAEASSDQPGVLSRIGRRFTGMFGG